MLVRRGVRSILALSYRDISHTPALTITLVQIDKVSA